ncbi:hypothetical protein AUC43_11935 [Hymenobacter sedentarius]|uniref:Uncharacterized protein n=1 Tax=Hymenobacter sedentarius TaxID=1411621 RepID=A0A0U4C606_9BACT|nr:hypothetical protein [Hymenobacter sedentarius]ALW85736.1 hypothetical protein AUC43_11935 [Hymenobacter sedentarius]
MSFWGAIYNHKKSLLESVQQAFFMIVLLRDGLEPGAEWLLAGPALAVRINLLPEHRQQTAVTLLGFFLAFNFLKARVYQFGEVLYRIATFRRGGHGANIR